MPIRNIKFTLLDLPKEGGSFRPDLWFDEERKSRQKWQLRDLNKQIIKDYMEVHHMQPVELKECPFCKNDDLIIQGESSNDGTIKWWSILHRGTSHCSIKMLDDNFESLVTKWNSR